MHRWLGLGEMPTGPVVEYPPTPLIGDEVPMAQPVLLYPNSTT
jgi:hypothetical protein